MIGFFDRPLLLVLAVLLPAAAVTLVLVWQRRRAARLARLGTTPMIRRLVPPNALRRPWWRAALLGAAAACAGIAMAGPRWGSEPTVVRGEGVDVVLALDASLSMLATDERPNRLEKMKQEVRRLRAASPSDRIALLAFAGRSYILTPLTIDDGALDLFLDNLDPSVVGQAGSSLARAIRQGTDLLLSTKTASDRALVVMSDGEAFEPEQDVADAARRAAEGGVSLVTVGFGTTAGSTIPVREGQTVTQKRDETGATVVTRYHPELLEAAARAANGTFIDAGTTDKAARIRAALGRLRAQQRSTESGREQTPRFQLFLLPALILLLADTLLAERRGRRARGPAAAATAAGLLLLFAAPRVAAANDLDDAAREYRAKQYARAAQLYRRVVEQGDQSPTTLYNLGTALLAADSLRTAVDALDRASRATDPEVRYRSLFNLGLAHLRAGLAISGDSAKPALDAALATYRKVLQMRSSDGDAKWNYELALRKQKSGGGGGGGGGANKSPSPSPDPSTQPQAPLPRPTGGIGQQQAEELLNSAAREERDVQGRKQKQNRPDPPPGGKDW